MSTNDKRERDLKMFGCTKQELEAAVGRSSRGMRAPHLRLAVSILSDAQELLVHGRNEDVRQLINRAKYFIMKGSDDGAV
jgi:hypothetical protein